MLGAAFALKSAKSQLFFVRALCTFATFLAFLSGFAWLATFHCFTLFAFITFATFCAFFAVSTFSALSAFLSRTFLCAFILFALTFVSTNLFTLLTLCCRSFLRSSHSC